jgi:DNA-binding XRE family transcriptional regulator
MTIVDLLLVLFTQVIIGVIIHKTVAAFRATKAELEQPKAKPSWDSAEDIAEKFQARFDALLKREFEARQRCWHLEDENTVLRFKLIDVQKRLAGEKPDQPNFEDDEDDEE